MISSNYTQAHRRNTSKLRRVSQKMTTDILVSGENRARAADLILPTRSGFLHCAYHAQFDAFSTPRFILFVLGMLEESKPMAEKIWGFTAESAIAREALETDLKERDGLQEALDAKQLELDSVISDPFPGTSV